MKVVDRIKSCMNFRNFINYLAIATVFGEAFTCRIVFSFWWNCYFKIYNLILVIIVIFFFFSLRKVYFNKIFLFLFSIIVYFSLFNVLMGNSVMFFFLPQVIVIFTHSLAFYLLIKFNKKDIKKLFLIYLNIAFFVGLVGLIQYIGYKAYFFTGYLEINQLLSDGDYAHIISYIRPFFDFSLIFSEWTNWRLTWGYSGFRINSIMPEPVSFCIVMMPAFFTALTSFMKNNFRFISKKKSLIIIASFIVTYSLVGYIAIFCAILLLSFNCLKLRRIILGVTAAILLLILFYVFNPDVHIRVKGIYKLLTGKTPLESVEQSTYTLARNALVTFDVVKENCVFGKGLSSHLISFEDYTKKAKIIDPPGIYILNKSDANSLFLRLLSETGLFGLIIFLVFISKYYIKKKEDNTNYLWIISNAIFVLFLIRLLRQGNYISEGFFFFFWLYYFARKIMKKTNIENMLIEKS